MQRRHVHCDLSLIKLCHEACFFVIVSFESGRTSLCGEAVAGSPPGVRNEVVHQGREQHGSDGRGRLKQLHACGRTVRHVVDYAMRAMQLLAPLSNELQGEQLRKQE